MWLKQLIGKFSRQLANQPKPRVDDPLWGIQKGVSSVEVSNRFMNEVMVPLVKSLNKDMGLSLRIAPGGGSAPRFRLLDQTGAYFGTVYMANPFNGRGFFQYPNSRSIELHSYALLLRDLREHLQEPEQEVNRSYRRRGR